MRTWLLGIVAIVLTALPVWAGQATSPAGTRRITELTGDLYRFHDTDGAMTVFLVTADGIVLVDPLSEAAATWLQAELTRRFPGRSVRWIVQTHHHYDRASGSAVFAGATTIGHDRFNAALAEARARLEPDIAALDVSGNKRLERAELDGTPREADLRARDLNNDGLIYPDEFYREVDGVSTTYHASFAIPLGGRTVRLVHVGPAHAPDLTAVFFQDQRLVFVADAIRPATFSPSSVRVRDAIAWARTLDALDFDTLLTDTNETMTKADVQTFRAYLEDLLTGVAEGYAAGRPVSDVQAALPLASHQATPAYAQRARHIAETYSQLRSRTFEVYGGPSYSIARPAHRYCSAAYSACGWPSRAGATMGGVSATFDRLTIGAEFSVAQQTVASRTTLLYDDTFAHRESGWSVLGGYRSRRHERLSYSALAGVAVTTVDVQGIYRLKESIAPMAGRSSITAHGTRKALVAGADVNWLLTSRLAVTVPIRLSWAGGTPPTPPATPFAANSYSGLRPVTPEAFWPGRMSLQLGVSVRVPLVLRVD